MTIKTYSVIYNRRRTPDADAICDRVNAITAGNGDSLYCSRVQDELDSICSREKQAFYQMEIIETENTIDDEEHEEARNYINGQFAALQLSDTYKSTIVISGGAGGKTKHISITNEQLEQIKLILCGGY